MRTISIRLDDHTDALLTEHCQRNGLTQTRAIKSAIEQMAGQQKSSPAQLAAELGLIGGFPSTEGDLAAHHAQRAKERLRAKRASDSVPATPSRRRRSTT
jgi:hypothetical protein